MYVHTCVHMLLHLQVLKSIHMCMYCMYWHTCVYMCIHVYICRPHTDHIYSFMCWCPQQAWNIPGGGGGSQRAPHRTAMGSSPATLSRDQGPIPTPVLAHPCALHASGGPKLPPCTAHGPSNHNGHLMTPSWAPSKLIWVGGAAHSSRVRQQQHLQTPSRHWISGLCMCMYVYVCVCMCMYVCIHVYVCACI